MTVFSPLPLDYVSLQRGLAGIEKTLNYIGYVPVVSSFSGAMRQFIGLIELVVSVALIIFNIFRGLFAGEEEMQPLIQDSIKLMEFAWHGLGNIVRGQFEMIPFINWSCALYDFAARHRMSYQHEPDQEVIRPILRRVRSGYF